MDTTATLEPQRTELDAGQVATVVVSVRNDSEIVEEYTLEVIGDLAEFCTVEPSHFSVYPGQAATAVLTAHPPRHPDVPAGEHFYGVHVLPTKQAGNATVPEGTIDVLPFHDTAAELSPQTSRSKAGSRYQIGLQNRGNSPVVVALAAKSASDELNLTLDESDLTVAPGGTASAGIQAEPVERLWRGTPVAYPFTVSVRPDEGPEIALAGTQYQEPVLPAWTLKALLGLVVLALLGVVAAEVLGKDGGGGGGNGDVVAVPAVVGKSVSEAEAVLDEAGLQVDRQEVFDDQVAKDIVMSVDPTEGEDAATDRPVVLTVSKGPDVDNGTTRPPTDGSSPDVVIPEGLVGLTEAQAQVALSSADLVAGPTSMVNSASVAQGVVMETEPSGGESVPPGTPVQLVVSTGMVEVPQLVDLSQDDAIAALEAEAIRLAHDVVLTPRVDVPPGQVVDQSPSGGVSVAQGSTITLTVSDQAPVPTVPADVDVVAALGTGASSVWPGNPWAGSVDVRSIVLENPMGYAGRFSIELEDTDSGTRRPLHEGELADLVVGQELVVDPEKTPGEWTTEDEVPTPPSPGPIQRFELTEGRNLLLNLFCAPALADGTPQNVAECAVRFSVDGEVREPGAFG